MKTYSGKKAFWILWKVYETFSIVIVTLAGFWVLCLTVMWFSDSYVLPNGMIVKREFSYSYSEWSKEVSDLYAADGKTRLATDIQGMCFNDRYVSVFVRDSCKLFDGTMDRPVPLSVTELQEPTGLAGKGDNSCNGYYTDWINARFLYQWTSESIVPPCSWRNFANPDLKDRDWLEKRPCGPQDWHGG